MRLLVFSFIVIVLLVVGFFCDAFLLVAMNGYSEEDATPGLLFYTIWAIIVSLLAAGLGLLIYKFFSAKVYSRLANFLLTSGLTLVLGLALDLLGFFLAIGIAEFNRQN